MLSVLALIFFILSLFIFIYYSFHFEESDRFAIYQSNNQIDETSYRIKPSTSQLVEVVEIESLSSNRSFSEIKIDIGNEYSFSDNSSDIKKQNIQEKYEISNSIRFDKGTVKFDKNLFDKYFEKKPEIIKAQKDDRISVLNNDYIKEIENISKEESPETSMVKQECEIVILSDNSKEKELENNVL
ncbi:MAG: hypothetical protein MHPSP_000733 [Paramarteilia canceri]